METKIRLPHIFPYGTTPDGGAVTNDFLAIINSLITTRSIVIPSFVSDESVAVEDGTIFIVVPEDMNGWHLTNVLSAVSVPSTDGNIEIKIRCSREKEDSRIDIDIFDEDMPLKILEGKVYGKINTKFRIQTGDLFFVDIVSAGNGALGLFTVLTFKE